jgi:hypothetical protein
MRLARMTTRRWMLAVVVVALAGYQMRGRAAHYRLRAEKHAKVEYRYRQLASRLPLMNPADFEGFCGTMTRGILDSPRLAEYYSDLRRKYEHAARYPWLPVDPDRPAPQ